MAMRMTTHESSHHSNQKEIIVNTALLQCDPALEILDFTHSEKYDVIIMGSRGMGHFKELVLGSVSNKILHHSVCLVIIIR